MVVCASATALRSGSGSVRLQRERPGAVGEQAAFDSGHRLDEGLRRAQPLVVEPLGQLQLGLGRQIEQLLETQQGHVLVDARANHQRQLVVTGHTRPQDLELRLDAGVEAGLHLAQRRVGLLEGRLGDGHQPPAQRRIEVGLGGVEQHLCPSGDQRLFSAAASDRHQFVLSGQAAAGIERSARTPTSRARCSPGPTEDSPTPEPSSPPPKSMSSKTPWNSLASERS